MTGNSFEHPAKTLREARLFMGTALLGGQQHGCGEELTVPSPPALPGSEHPWHPCPAGVGASGPLHPYG